MVDFFFVDDSRPKPVRLPEMGDLVAVGGVYVPSEAAATLEREIEAICNAAGFPEGEVFKWSPSEKHWMRNNLVGASRKDFFQQVLQAAARCNVRAVVIAEDTQGPAAAQHEDHELDATVLFLERANGLMERLDRDGMVIVAEPRGGRKSEAHLRRSCRDMLRDGTKYANLDRLPLGVITAPFVTSRGLQLADLIVSCTAAMVTGNTKYSSHVFPDVCELLDSHGGRKGGYGLKIHSDYKYRNLYHWLLGDVFIDKGKYGRLPIPHERHLYASNPYDEAL